MTIAPAAMPGAASIRTPGRKDRFAFSIVRAAESHGLNVLVWRDQESRPLLSGFDLDLVAPRRSRAPFERLLERECERDGWTVLLIIALGARTTFLVAARSAEPGEDDGFLQIDLHTSLTSRGLPFASIRDLVRRSRVRDGVRCMDPNDAAVVSWLEPALSQVRPKPEYAAAFDLALSSRGDECRRLLEDAVGSSEGRVIFAKGSQASDAPGLRRGLIAHALLRRPVETGRVMLARLFSVARGLASPAGRMWVVSGPDGAGKSALLEAMRPLVERRMAIAVTSLHTRPYLVPRLGRILPMRRHKREALLNERRYEARVGLAKSIVRLALLVVDYTAGYWIRVRPKLAEGRLVVFDRYAQDYLVDPRLRGIDLPASILDRFLRLAPGGHRRVLVLARPETLVERKSEIDASEAARQIGRYREVFSSDPTALVLHTDSESASAVARRLASALLDDLRRDAAERRP